MSRASPVPGGRLGFEAFGTAAGLALVTGGLSVVAPFFSMLTGTLVALGLAGWAAAPRRRGDPRPTLRAPGRVAGLLALGAGAILYLAPPAELDPYRALLLALGLAALWRLEREPRRSGAAFAEAAG